MVEPFERIRKRFEEMRDKIDCWSDYEVDQITVTGKPPFPPEVSISFRKKEESKKCKSP